jgi:microcin C transport system permease protein
MPDPATTAVLASRPLSPGRQVWNRFKRNRVGYWSLIIFAVLYGVSLGAELLSNNKPLLVRYQGEFYVPLLHDYTERQFGGDLPLLANYQDPVLLARFDLPGNWAIFPPNRFSYDTLNYFGGAKHYPGRPDRENWLGTDIAGYDVFARLIYGFRVSVTFAFLLTLTGIVIGTTIGAVQGYFAGKIDLVTQRFIEIWGALPELYLLIIFSAVFDHSYLLIFILLSLFGWITLSDYVRAEFLRNRQLEFVKSARAMGLSGWQIMWHHILPNSLTPLITFLPFRMSAAIVALASLDFLGLGVTAPSPSLGHLLIQGKENLDSWWISLSAFSALVVTMLLLTLIGDALRNALDTRHGLDRLSDTAATPTVTPTPTTVVVPAPAATAQAGV